jgi:ABC-type spermidine/putrescine transport system permease subunit I
MTVLITGAAFPLLINAYAGVKNVNQVLVNVVRSFGANEWQRMKVVVLPNSLPYIIAGLRLAIGRAILGVLPRRMPRALGNPACQLPSQLGSRCPISPNPFLIATGRVL